MGGAVFPPWSLSLRPNYGGVMVTSIWKYVLVFVPAKSLQPFGL